MSTLSTLTWNDQDILLYHGTLDKYVNAILTQINLNQSNPFCDFGKGFYTTTNHTKAVMWANSIAASTDTPVVIEFQVERNQLAQLECLFFVRGDPNADDFWSFVKYCRMTGDHNRAYAQSYDVVAGPVVGSLKKQTVIPGTDQISFHTRNAITILDNSSKRRMP